MAILTVHICTSCGRRTAEGICQTCNQATVPMHLIPKRCADCGTSLKLPPHLRTSMEQCEDCAVMNRDVIGLWAWNDLLCDLV